MRLYCATSNPGKLREFALAAEHLAAGAFSFEPLRGIPPCEETGLTFEENAAQKAEYYSGFAPGLCFAEDSGIEVDSLGGAPGVYSARFAGPGATDEENNQRLIERLRGKPDRAARYVCVVALAEQGEVVAAFRGQVEGVIVDEPRGGNGFGYDPHFFYPPFGCTFAEAAPEQKLEVSHRRIAVEQMLRYLLSGRR
ncbi:MAG: RdgB/HAM1 family non-canonical purine NTP pyrophosphatase [Bryobacteraceae bacterium]